MRAYDIIWKKRNGCVLTREEIDFFIHSYTVGEIPDYQASAFLMAVFLRGMSPRETTLLTRAMSGSGKKMDLSGVRGVKVDKHSTGGVGDGTSLVLAPVVASLGVPVPMISGRSLGHTGGTLDKLESIPGFRVNLSAEEFVRQLAACNLALIGQTDELAPADRKLYALRDVTATVESIPLISASILSKKLAEGCDALVLDVKTGSGAFMPDQKSACQLARTIVDIGKRSGIRMAALVTDMSQPLGRAVGNSLEVRQAVEILKGSEEEGVKDFIELSDVLAGWMLFLAGAVKSSPEGKEKARRARLDGSGLKKFREVVEAQGGDPRVCESPHEVLPRAAHVKTVVSLWKGTVSVVDARAVGVAGLLLGAGRQTQESLVDLSAGIVLHKKVGDRVERGEALADLHTSDPGRIDAAEKMFLSAYRIGKGRASRIRSISKIIR